MADSPKNDDEGWVTDPALFRPMSETSPRQPMSDEACANLMEHYVRGIEQMGGVLDGLSEVMREAMRRLRLRSSAG